jgi:hypothetical protein
MKFNYNVYVTIYVFVILHVHLYIGESTMWFWIVLGVAIYLYLVGLIALFKYEEEAFIGLRDLLRLIAWPATIPYFLCRDAYHSLIIQCKLGGDATDVDQP